MPRRERVLAVSVARRWEGARGSRRQSCRTVHRREAVTERHGQARCGARPYRDIDTGFGAELGRGMLLAAKARYPTARSSQCHLTVRQLSRSR